MPGRVRRHPGIVLTLILIVGLICRCAWLGRDSFWYDEVVSVRLAESRNPAELIRLLGETDATRAPLHPLMLWAWLRAFGDSETMARGLSVAFGLATIVTVFALGRRAGSTRAGLVAAWLAALSPMLVMYSREARMYAQLAFFSSLAWLMLLCLRRRHGPMVRLLYAASLIELVYTHPLGLLMVAAHMAAIVIHPRRFRVGWSGWGAIWIAWGLAVIPWFGRYLDHPPEYVLDRPTLKLLLGTPIGWLGGNAWTLPPLIGLVLFGMVGRRRSGRFVRIRPVETDVLLCGLIVSVLALFLISRVGPPIFGPARYTLFAAPAWLVLAARGIARLPTWPARLALLAAPLISVPWLYEIVAVPGRKADWKAASAWLRIQHPKDAIRIAIVHPDPRAEVDHEAAAARHYLPAEVRIVSVTQLSPEPPSYLARTGPGWRTHADSAEVHVVPGLVLEWFNRRPAPREENPLREESSSATPRPPRPPDAAP